MRNMLAVIFSITCFWNSNNQLQESSSGSNISLTVLFTQNNEVGDMMIYKLENLSTDTFNFDNRNGFVGIEEETTVVYLGMPDLNLHMVYNCNILEPMTGFQDTVVFAADGVQFNMDYPIDLELNLYKLEPKELLECRTNESIDPKIMQDYPLVRVSAEFLVSNYDTWRKLNFAVQKFGM